MDIQTLQNEISAAIEVEKRAVVERLGLLGIVDTVELEDGRRILSEPGAYRYRFHCALPVQLPEGSTGRLEAPGFRASSCRASGRSGPISSAARPMRRHSAASSTGTSPT